MFVLKLYHLYLIALIPVLASMVLSYFSKGRITLKEWASGAAGAFLCAAIMHGCSVASMTTDTETWSGSVTKAIYEPWWKARWKEDDYIRVPSGTDENGMTTYRRVYVGWHYEYRTHEPKWYIETDLGQTIGVSQSFANNVSSNFGNWVASHWDRYRYFEGDINRYLSVNRTSFLQPVTKMFTFENRAKAAPSRFSFKKVPKEIPVFEYPENKNAFASDRLLGTAKQTINLFEFDRMNSRLGPVKFVNVIMIGFGDQPQSIVDSQRSKWYGGKKNDLVLCYGGPDPLRPSWVSVFGWSQENIDQPLLAIMASSNMDTSILPAIEKTIYEKYEMLDWDSMMKQIDIEMPPWAWWVMILFILISQGGYYFWSWYNEFEDEEKL